MHPCQLRRELSQALIENQPSLEMTMKKHAIALGIALCSLLGAAAQAATVTVSPSTNSVMTGDTFTLDLKISGLGSEIVSVFDLNVYFNPAMLKATGYSLGGGLGGPWFDLSAIAGDNFDLFAFSELVDPTDPATDDALAALQTPGGFTMISLSFEAIGTGVSMVDFGLGANERDIVGRNAQFLNVQYQGACVAVNDPRNGNNACNTVPEPATYGLAGLALLGAFAPAALRRRRESAKA